MDQGLRMGVAMGVPNTLLGLLLALWSKRIGAAGARLGRRVCEDIGLPVPKLYEQGNARRFVFVVGVCLIVWGIVAFIVLPRLLRSGVPQ